MIDTLRERVWIHIRMTFPERQIYIRSNGRVQVGSSPRGTLALMKLSRGRAALQGRDYVIPEDVKAVAVPALSHRLSLRPELWVQKVRAEDVVRDCLDSVPSPSAEDSTAHRR